MIDNPNMITIAVNPKEYLKKYRYKEVNKKHKPLRKDSPGMDFDTYARRTLSLNDHERIIKMYQQKIQNVCKSRMK